MKCTLRVCGSSSPNLYPVRGLSSCPTLSPSRGRALVGRLTGPSEAPGSTCIWSSSVGVTTLVLVCLFRAREARAEGQGDSHAGGRGGGSLGGKQSGWGE